MYIVIIIIVLAWTIGFTWGGAAMCSKNNAAGLILCFLGTFLLGLLIGFVCLSNAREKVRYRKDQINQKIIITQETKRDEASKEDKEIIKDLLKQNQELLNELKKKDYKIEDENQESKQKG